MTRLYDDKGPATRTLAGAPREPQIVKWHRNGPPGRCAWFTETAFGEAQGVEADAKVAILIESPAVSADPYAFIEVNPGLFDAVLSYWRDWRPAGVNVLPYDVASSRLNLWDCHLGWAKGALVSIIAPPKGGLPGHAMRHQLVAERPSVAAYGVDYQPLRPNPSGKIETLGPYMFQVVCQSSRFDYFFTEALIDPFLTGTIPIYYGCPSIGDIFDPRGMFQVDSLKSLIDTVDNLSPSLYEQMRPFARENHRRARFYIDIEDGLFRRYPHLFDEDGDA